MSDRVVLVDSTMRASPRNVRRTDTNVAIGNATVAWAILNTDRTAVPAATGTGSLRAGSANDYDSVIPVSVLQTLTVDGFYILQLVVTQGGNQRTIERKVQVKRGY